MPRRHYYLGNMPAHVHMSSPHVLDCWQGAKAIAMGGGTPAYVTHIGDSVTAGEGSTDPNVTSFAARLRDMMGWNTYAEYFPAITAEKNSESATQPWSAYNASFLGNITTPFIEGWHKCFRRNTGGTAAYYFATYTVPYASVKTDIIYMQLTAGTFQFNVSGSGSFNWTIDGVAQSAGTLGADTPVTVSTFTTLTAKMSVISITTTLPQGTTINVGKDTGAGVLRITGIASYKSTTGIGFARMCGGSALMSNYQAKAGSTNVPIGNVFMHSGSVPNIAGPQPPSPALTAVVKPTPASGGAGNVDAGTRNYGFTYLGSGGESAMSSPSNNYVQAGATTVTISGLINPPGTGNSPFAGITNSTINVYVTKAANNGAGSPGSAGNPWFLVGNAVALTGNSATVTHNVADSSLPAAWTGPTAAPTFGAWGFPLAAPLSIIAMGLNDLGSAPTTPFTLDNAFEDSLVQMINCIRRGRDNASIIIVGMPLPPIVGSDAAFYPAALDAINGWTSALDVMGSVSRSQNCVFVNAHSAFGPNGISRSLYLTGGVADGVHPNDTGHQLIANVIASVPGL